MNEQVIISTNSILYRDMFYIYYMAKFFLQTLYYFRTISSSNGLFSFTCSFSFSSSTVSCLFCALDLFYLMLEFSFFESIFIWSLCFFHFLHSTIFCFVLLLLLVLFLNFCWFISHYRSIFHATRTNIINNNNITLYFCFVLHIYCIWLR